MNSLYLIAAGAFMSNVFVLLLRGEGGRESSILLTNYLRTRTIPSVGAKFTLNILMVAFILEKFPIVILYVHTM